MWKVDEEGQGGAMSCGCFGGFPWCREKDDAAQAHGNGNYDLVYLLDVFYIRTLI